MGIRSFRALTKFTALLAHNKVRGICFFALRRPTFIFADRRRDVNAHRVGVAFFVVSCLTRCFLRALEPRIIAIGK